jgi:hypothetical protein
MSIEKSEKFVALTTTYVRVGQASHSPEKAFVLAISGLAHSVYTVVYMLES